MMKLRQLRRSEEDEMRHGRSGGRSHSDSSSKTSSSNRPPKIARENLATFDNYAVVAQKAAAERARVKLGHSQRASRQGEHGEQKSQIGRNPQSKAPPSAETDGTGRPLSSQMA